jgi:hypothetical protein
LAGTVRTIGQFRHHAFEAHVAGGAKQIGADLALLEGRDEDAVGAAREQLCEVLLAHG